MALSDNGQRFVPFHKEMGQAGLGFVDQSHGVHEGTADHDVPSHTFNNG